jgi:PAS domain S-box-containing protein
MTQHRTFEDAERIRICQGDIDYQGIVKHINDGVVIIREGKIVFANNAFYEISQKTPDQVIAADFSDFVSPADREEVAKYCTERLFTGSLCDRIEFAMPMGNEAAIIEMKVSVVECGGAPAILGALTDITERRKTRSELQRIKERLESILHSMNDVVVSLAPNDYAILGINPAAEALYGVPLRDFTSGEKHIMRFVHPHDEEIVDQYYKNLPEAEFDELQYRIISSNKKVKWVLDEGHAVYSDKGTIRRIDHVIRDITEEKKAIDALKQSEAKYRDFFESTNDMAYAVTPEGAFLDINDAGMKLLGFESKEEALASNLRNFYVDPSERAGLLAEINEEGYIEDKQLKFKNKAGDIIEVSVTARAKTDDSGYLLYYEGIAHNITKALEDQRNRVLRNAAGGMCHHLNTHLMQLHGSNDAIREEMESLNALIEKIAGGENPHEIAKRMKGIMEDMHDFCKGISGAYERISEVTKAFNKAYHYKEESYVTSTILDIFRAYGYQEND